MDYQIKTNMLDMYNFVNNTQWKFFLFLRVSYHLLYLGMMAYAIILLQSSEVTRNAKLSAVVGLTMGTLLLLTHLGLLVTGNKAFFGHLQSLKESRIAQRLWVIGLFTVLHLIWFWVTSHFALQGSNQTVRNVTGAVLAFILTWTVVTLTWFYRKIIPAWREKEGQKKLEKNELDPTTQRSKAVATPLGAALTGSPRTGSAVQQKENKEQISKMLKSITFNIESSGDVYDAERFFSENPLNHQNVKECQECIERAATREQIEFLRGPASGFASNLPNLVTQTHRCTFGDILADLAGDQMITNLNENMEAQ